ncbi:MAG: hypothetical protein JWM11_4077 [Planctomycetaceae bacterium]|nr:hypothetical protein [Planctomycetaceae bacterium]
MAANSIIGELLGFADRFRNHNRQAERQLAADKGYRVPPEMEFADAAVSDPQRHRAGLDRLLKGVVADYAVNPSRSRIRENSGEDGLHQSLTGSVTWKYPGENLIHGVEWHPNRSNLVRITCNQVREQTLVGK